MPAKPGVWNRRTTASASGSVGARAVPDRDGSVAGTGVTARLAQRMPPIVHLSTTGSRRAAEAVPGHERRGRGLDRLVVPARPVAQLCCSASFRRTSSMSSARTCSMSFSSRFSGRAPGWANTITPSRMAMIVGIDLIPYRIASSCSVSVSTLPNTMSVCFCEERSNTGANWRQGPHQAAQKSTSTMPSREATSSKLAAVSSTVAMASSSRWWGNRYATPNAVTAIVIPGPRAGPAPPARAVGGARTRGGQWWGDRHLPVRRGLRVLLLVCAVHPAVDPHLRRRRRLAAARRPVRAGADRGGVRRGGAVGGAGPAAAGRTRRHRRTAALQPRGVADRRVATGPAPGPRLRLAGLPLGRPPPGPDAGGYAHLRPAAGVPPRSEEHTSELQSRPHLVCRLLPEKKNTR